MELFHRYKFKTLGDVAWEDKYPTPFIEQLLRIEIRYIVDSVHEGEINEKLLKCMK